MRLAFAPPRPFVTAPKVHVIQRLLKSVTEGHSSHHHDCNVCVDDERKRYDI